MSAFEELSQIFEANKDKRICVLGTTCSGKSTLNKKFVESEDMDQVVFAHLTPNEIASVDVDKWSPEIGERMEELAVEHVSVEPGKPVFGTVVFDCDLIVYLDVDDKLLKDRCEMRGVSYKNAKAMDNWIKQQISRSNTPVVSVNVDRNIESKTH